MPRKTLAPLTAFNEMETLDRVGQFGWHSVRYGILFHVVEQSEVQWEHLRVEFSADVEGLVADGWTAIGSGWFPGLYFARPTTLPAVYELD